MSDQGYNLTFDSKGCKIRKVGSRILVAYENINSSNVYIINGGKILKKIKSWWGGTIFHWCQRGRIAGRRGVADKGSI